VHWSSLPVIIWIWLGIETAYETSTTGMLLLAIFVAKLPLVGLPKRRNIKWDRGDVESCAKTPPNVRELLK